MFDSAARSHPDPGSLSEADIAVQLPLDAYYELVRTLRLTLPSPAGDSPEDLVRRDHAAIARIAALCPANAAEADVAAQFVAASEQWKDCLRLAQLPDTTPEWAAKCRAQAHAMMRQSLAALRLLLRVQEARRKLEADHAAADRLAWTEHRATRLMAEALGSPQIMPAAGIEPPLPVPEPQPEPTPAQSVIHGSHADGSPGHSSRLEPDCVIGAEQCALIHPKRAPLVRRTRPVPDDLAPEPPAAAMVGGLIASGGPASAALDRTFAQPGTA